MLHFESFLHHLGWLLPSTSKNVLLIKMSKLALRDKQWILGINVLCGYHTTPKLHFIGVCTVFHRFLKNQEMWYLLRTLSLSRSNKEEILLTEDKISLELLGEKWKKSSWWATSMKIFRQIFIMLRNYAKNPLGKLRCCLLAFTSDELSNKKKRRRDNELDPLNYR